MVTIGLSYLIFEKILLTRSASVHDSVAPANNAMSRVLIGIQVNGPPPRTHAYIYTI